MRAVSSAAVAALSLSLATWPGSAAPLVGRQRSASRHLRELSQAKSKGTESRSRGHPRFYMDEEYWRSWQNRCNESAEYFKTLPDRQFYTNLADHPWRTQDEWDADIVVVPALLGLSANGGCGRHMHNMRDLLEYLSNSTRYWKHYGSDHIISGHSWKAQYAEPVWMEELVRNMTTIMCDLEHARNYANFDVKTHYARRAIVSPYMTVYKEAPMAQVKFEERSYSVSFVGQSLRKHHAPATFHEKGYAYHGYDLRDVAIRELSKHFIDGLFVCAGSCSADYNMCDQDWRPNGCRTESDAVKYATAMVQSKFGLFFRGDTSSSSHMYDLISAGSIPIIISDGFMHESAVFPDFVPWRRFALFIPEQQFLDDPAGSVSLAIDMSQEELDERLAILQNVKRCLDWLDPDTMVPTLILYEMAMQSALMSHIRPDDDAWYCQGGLETSN